MTDLDLAILPIVAAVGGAVMKLAHWIVTTWAAIRREEIKATTERAAEAASRMSDRQNATIDRIADRVDEHTTKDLACSCGSCGADEPAPH